jgi:meromycolic acid enoyl-[acyl-carrier protein] reductase
VILVGKRILVTGVVNRRSIAFAIAELAQRHGAEVALSSFGRVRRLTERTAQRLPEPAAVLDLDVNDDDSLAALTETLGEAWGGVDGAVHAVAFAPEDALGGRFLSAPRESALAAFETSAYSLKALAQALLPLWPSPDPERPRASGGSLVGLDFDASVAWPSYDWMGVAKAGLEATSRYLARDLGPHGVRANLISAGPIETVAAGGVPGFRALAEGWTSSAPLGWDTRDPGPVAGAAVFLLSDLAAGISGEIVHVDGGMHAVAPTSHGNGASEATPEAAVGVDHDA